MRVYIAGPMTGLPDFNYPAFHAEAARLRELGYRVSNPAENQAQVNWQYYMRAAIRMMLLCDAVALLPNWKQSRGALIEHGIAIALGIPARPCEEFQGELDVMTRSNYAMRTQGELPHA
jgi:nucleoside 2-deoxyribosyltransferase